MTGLELVTPALGVVSKEEMRARVLRLEDEMRKLPQGEFEIIHHFAPGLYAREMRMQAGDKVVGKIHRFAHLCALRGKAAFTSDTAVETIEDCTWLAPAGSKRAIHALTDLSWTVFHVTDLTDLAAIEAYFIAPDFEALENKS